MIVEALTSTAIALLGVAIAVGAGAWQARRNFDRDHRARLAVELLPDVRHNLRGAYSALGDSVEVDVGPVLESLGRAAAVACVLDERSESLAGEAFRRIESVADFSDPGRAMVGHGDRQVLWEVVENDLVPLEDHVLELLRKRSWVRRLASR